MSLQHLRSSTANKRPVPGNMSDGQIAINTNTGSPGLFFKDSNNTLVKVGPVHVGTTAPNASPASGGTAGNSVGEQWLDTTGGTYVFKVWDGSAWRSETGTFVDVNGDVMTGALGIIAGSAGSPGLYFSGDNNTGIYSPGADQVAISTGGSGRLFVDASGNVGVGAAPSTRFETYVASGGNTLRLTNASNTGSDSCSLQFVQGGAQRAVLYTASNILYLAGDATTVLSAGTTSPLVFNAGGSERLRITSAGLVGVGISSPGAGVHISTAGQTTAALDTAGSLNTIISDTGFAAGNGGSLVFGASGGVYRFAAIKGLLSDGSSNSQGSLAFSTRNASTDSTLTERLRITPDGRVGIATTSPAVPLDVAGSIRSSTGILFGTDTAAANELDDYEEGTFTPTIVGTTSAGTGTYTNQIGRYTKIGDRVTFTIYLNWTAHTGTGNIRVSNLPFTSTSATGSFHAVSIYADGIPFTGPWLQAYVGVNSTNIGMGQMTAAGVVSGIPMDSAGDITITGHYEV